MSLSLVAYVGPGPGLSMLGALIGLIATLGFAVWAFAMWPIRILARKWRQNRQLAASAKPSDQ